MKKEKMITRTLTFTDVEVVAFDINTMTGDKHTVPILGDIKNDKDALKACKELNTFDKVTIVSAHVVGHTTKLYGMLERDFYTSAEELPPRKVYEYDIVSTD